MRLGFQPPGKVPTLVTGVKQTMNEIEKNFHHAATIIADANALVITAGAGMGCDSGLPDFRGKGGFWNAYPALAKAQIQFSNVANPRAFEDDPGLAWGFYGHRLALYRATVPHAGFEILRQWSASMSLGCWVYTSNVDGQFQKAGFAESSINECHGSIHHLQCTSDCQSGVWRGDDFLPQVDMETCQLTNDPPTCPVCGNLARPNIVMFGDWNWNDDRNRLQQARQERWFKTVASNGGTVAVVEIGAGTAIPSARHFGQQISKKFGVQIIRINLREGLVSTGRDVGIALGALEGLEGIHSALGQIR